MSKSQTFSKLNKKQYNNDDLKESFEEYLGASSLDNHSNEKKRSVEPVPLLYVDINLGPENIERIVVFEGNTAEDLAKEFS